MEVNTVAAACIFYGRQPAVLAVEQVALAVDFTLSSRN
jgi:hypothetical protein